MGNKTEILNAIVMKHTVFLLYAIKSTVSKNQRNGKKMLRLTIMSVFDIYESRLVPKM